MRIGLVATVSTPVRAVGSGSVEGVVCVLARELVALGHVVTVFGAEHSSVPGCELVTVPGTYGRDGMPADYQHCELLNLANALRRSSDFEVLHAHAYLVARLVEGLSAAPVVHTLHTQPYESEATLVRLSPDIRLTSLSHYQWRALPDVAPVVVPHGIGADDFSFRPVPEPRLCYLGRFLPGKGPLHAVRVARELGMPLLLAGPQNEYFDAVVRPHVDGRTVHYVGTVDGRSRDELLGGSAALLYPLTHGEPFGLVMAEAMMCGTPVVATPVGAVPEVVEPGTSGVIAPLEQLGEATRTALGLDRWVVREAAVERFAGRRMAERYERVYASAVSAQPVHRVEQVAGR